MLLGVDTGGTFTDFVLLPGKGAEGGARTHKVLSSPEAPERAILQGILEMGLESALRAGELRIVHGSTVATNAALEGKGARTAFITNRGLKDMLAIARQVRPRLYALETPPSDPPVPPELCLETGGRVDAQGRTLEPLTGEDMRELGAKLKALAPRAVAVNLLFSFLDDSHERRLAEHLRGILPEKVYISRSSQVLPEYREYERGIATWLNASLGPLVRDYLLELEKATHPAPLSVMQSSGGTIAAAQAAERAVHLLLSGPAGGLSAAAFLTGVLGETRLMTFDMGGTSTDVALLNGAIRLSTEGRIGPWPVGVPMVDMHTIGAGGGSIAHLDAGGLLRVGPQSAGAAPGPACYGRGGTQPTVTDANVVLGRLPASVRLAGSFSLDTAAAREAVSGLGRRLNLSTEEAAQGIISLANEHMARALRAISVERGFDPAAFRLCCFGGAGGLHVCSLANALGMRRALVPVHAGVLSALGMLAAPAERHLSRTFRRRLDVLEAGDVARIAAELRAAGREDMRREGLPASRLREALSADLRYVGQSSELNVPWTDREQAARDFHRLHEARYGHALAAAVELVTLRLALRGDDAPVRLSRLPEGAPAAPLGMVALHGHAAPVPLYARPALAPGQELPGPALLTEATCTVFLEEGWNAVVDAYGNLLLEKTPE